MSFLQGTDRYSAFSVIPASPSSSPTAAVGGGMVVEGVGGAVSPGEQWNGEGGVV